MGRWRKTINIKEFLGDDTSPKGIKMAAEGIIPRLDHTFPTDRLQKAADMADADPETALLVFNDGLDRIYDWADRNRIWLA